MIASVEGGAIVLIPESAILWGLTLGILLREILLLLTGIFFREMLVMFFLFFDGASRKDGPCPFRVEPDLMECLIRLDFMIPLSLFAGRVPLAEWTT